jgi:hypothetical protein
MTEQVEQVKKSEIIMNYSFSIHQSRDKMVQTQLSTGQKLNVLAVGSGSFDFLIANFTNPGDAIQPDQPDVTYLLLNQTFAVNMTWSPPTRLPYPGSYYLIFLARNASSDSPVEVNSNVTKTWTDIHTVQVVASDRRALLDQSFKYVGGGTAILGAVMLLFTSYLKHKPRARRRERLSPSD